MNFAVLNFVNTAHPRQYSKRPFCSLSATSSGPGCNVLADHLSDFRRLELSFPGFPFSTANALYRTVSALHCSGSVESQASQVTVAGGVFTSPHQLRATAILFSLPFLILHPRLAFSSPLLHSPLRIAWALCNVYSLWKLHFSKSPQRFRLSRLLQPLSSPPRLISCK